MELRDRIVLVIGAGSGGCGRAIALRFASGGAKLVLSDLAGSDLVTTRDLLRSRGGEAEACESDIRSESSVRELFTFAERAFGGLDIVVNCASAPYRPGVPSSEWMQTVEVDLLGALHVTRHAFEALQRRGSGALVHFSSTSAIHHRPSRAPAYDLSKAAVTRLVSSLGGWREAHRIRVNGIAPDWVATPQVAAYVEGLTPEQRKKEGIPALTPVDEIVDAVVRLATDESLAGRMLVWWSDQPPGLIASDDRGYAALEPFA